MTPMNTPPQLLTTERVAELQGTASALLDGLDAVLFGQQDLTRAAVMALMAGGHVLLEGLPGLGKTELVKALAALSGMAFSRIQFTPDLMPGDITGNPILQEQPEGGRALVFRPGPIFAQVVLADEINRASPKTQSALLQAMQEHTVTVVGQTHALPAPFFVLATQNPVELDGTYPLPEAQLDRFHVKLTVTGVGPEILTRILLERPGGRAPMPGPVTDAAGIMGLIQGTRDVVLAPAVADYIARIVNATRPELPGAPALVAETIRWGASPRGAISLAGGARAKALLAGRPAVGFEDVRAVAADVLAHRLIRSYDGSLRGVQMRDVVAELLGSIQEIA